jgi:hypothetical protein
MQEHGLPRTIRDGFAIEVGSKPMTIGARDLIVSATDLGHHPICAEAVPTAHSELATLSAQLQPSARQPHRLRPQGGLA